MGKQLNFVYNGIDYTLEYTRKTIEQMERKGFKVSELADKPMTTLPVMFAGAFLAHHKYVRQDVIDDIFSKMANKNALLDKLAEMYQDPLLTLLEEQDEKNAIQWDADF